MKIALAQLNYHIGDIEGNLAKIKEAVAQAKTENAELVVFAELALCGYTPGDFLYFESFLERCYSAIDELAKESENIGIIVGAPSPNKAKRGKDLHNSAYFLFGGEVKSIHNKSLLPTYDVFDEYRYFEPGLNPEVLNFKGHKIALTVCEDLWDVVGDPMYNLRPMDSLKDQGADLMINIAASPFSHNYAEKRQKIMRTNVEQYGIPLCYVNQIGAHTAIIFDGGSLIYSGTGKLIRQLPFFEEHLAYIETDELDQAAEDTTVLDNKISRIYNGLVLGVRDYFRKSGFTKAILGLSGGIDSAVTLAIAAEALGSENMLAVLLPSQFTSENSGSDARDMIRKLGCPSEEIPIEGIYNALYQNMPARFRDTEFDITEENIQARARSMALMALANKFGYVLLNTSNKSEAAVGYGTLYGDMSGGLGVIGDVYKTQVYELAAHINAKDEIIPQAIIDRPPSAELSPGQLDSDSLPEYGQLDAILYQYIDKEQGPAEIIAKGFDEALVKRILNLVDRAEYKRHQTPPILRVSNKAFGIGRRLPIVGKYL